MGLIQKLKSVVHNIDGQFKELGEKNRRLASHRMRTMSSNPDSKAAKRYYRRKSRKLDRAYGDDEEMVY